MEVHNNDEQLNVQRSWWSVQIPKSIPSTGLGKTGNSDIQAVSLDYKRNVIRDVSLPTTYESKYQYQLSH